MRSTEPARRFGILEKRVLERDDECARKRITRVKTLAGHGVESDYCKPAVLAHAQRCDSFAAVSTIAADDFRPLRASAICTASAHGVSRMIFRLSSREALRT